MVDEAGMGKQLACRADIYVALPVKDEIRTAELAVGPGRFVPYRHVRGDRAIHEPLEQPSHAINGVAGKPFGPKSLFGKFLSLWNLL